MMSPRVSRRLVIRGELVADSAVHVGSGESGMVDLPVMIDAWGSPLIPGTSIAGCLRRAMSAAGWSTSRLDDVFGWSGEGDAGGASRLLVEDAIANSSVDLEVRTTTAIDRVTGAGKAGALFSREVIPAGTKFDFALELEEVRGQEGVSSEGDDQIAALIKVLSSGISVGAATTRGLGRVHLDSASITHQSIPLAGRDEFLFFLSNPTPTALPQEVRDRIDNSEAHAQRITVELSFEAVGAMLSSVEVESGPVDRVPLATQSDHDHVRLVIPGSSVKGALRARAELISSTMGQATHDTHIHNLFGRAAEMVASEGGSEKVQVGRRGSLFIDDITSRAAVPSDLWSGVLDAHADANHDDQRRSARSSLKKAIGAFNKVEGAPFLMIADHVAIDRWTGGAADSKLYSMIEPHSISDGWSPLHINLDLTTVPDGERPAAVALLLLILREFVDGWVPLGFGTRKGLGQVRVKDWSFDVSTGLDEWQDLSDWSLDQLNEPPAVVLSALKSLVHGVGDAHV